MASKKGEDAAKGPRGGGKITPPPALKVVRGASKGAPPPRSPGAGGPASSRRRREEAPALLGAAEYVRGVLAGDRTILGRAVTLVESNVPAHRERAQEVLEALIPKAGKAIRVGVTGVPGAGKSTFIEALGCRLADSGRKVAVMAVDPTSSVSRGSILGDKTRMDSLARHPRAFIRPSPTQGTLGGVARKTREAIVLFEAAGYDVILVETVGVGQSEIAVRSLVDFFLLLLVPGTGDELQGIKKGVIELADAIVVNKADGGNEEAARAAGNAYSRVLSCLQPATEGWRTEVFTASALTGEGVDEIWKAIEAFRRVTRASGVFERRRREQARDWLHGIIRERLETLFFGDPGVAGLLASLEKKVVEGTLPAVRAADELMKAFAKSHEKKIRGTRSGKGRRGGDRGS